MRHNRKYRPSAFRTYVEWANRARERRTAVTVSEFRVSVIKDGLTLWFYCVKEAARRHGIGGEPRKSKGFAGMRASVRRGTAVRHQLDAADADPEPSAGIAEHRAGQQVGDAHELRHERAGGPAVAGASRPRSLLCERWTLSFQPRSGDRMQPTASAVGVEPMK